MSDLQASFDQAVEDARTKLPSSLNNAEKASLYGLFKQATEGPCTGERPGVFSQVARYKYDAWKAHEGKSSDEAKKEFRSWIGSHTNSKFNLHAWELQHVNLLGPIFLLDMEHQSNGSMVINESHLVGTPNLTIGRGSMHHLYKYKPDHKIYHARTVYESREKIILPPINRSMSLLANEMRGNFVPIRRNKDFPRTIPRDDPFFKSLNWADANNPEGVPLVNPSINQQACGSCWAFAAVGSLETSVARHAQNVTREGLPQLSVQELLNCFSPERCTIGGNPLTAFDYIYRFGLSSSAKIPYTGTPGLCSTHTKPVAKAAAWGILSPHHDTLVALTLRHVGPVAAAMNGAHPAFARYRSGIFAPAACSPTPNHAVLITGYGETVNGTKYWIARNSWGREWGEDGFVKILRQSHGLGVCGILHSPSVALGGYRIEDSTSYQVDKLHVSTVLICMLSVILVMAIPLSHVCRSPWRERRRQRRRLLLNNNHNLHAKYGSTN